MPGKKKSHRRQTGVTPKRQKRPRLTEERPSSGGGVSIASSQVSIGGDVVGRDKIIVSYNYYSSKDLQIRYLPPSVQHELVDHKEELKQALAGLKARKTVLLWGVGGVGKTNLAAHAAYEAGGNFEDGVIWIEVGDGDLYSLCDGLARALGDDHLPRLPAAEKADAVRRLLAGRRALLVLDNVRREKTLEAAPGLCPATVGLLATSRQNSAAFRVRVEIKPLVHPQARLLFCQRADLPASMAYDPNVEIICREWGGYPLGIVLSAKRKVEERLPLERLVQHLRQVRLPGEQSTYISPEHINVQNLLEDHFQQLAPAELAVLSVIAANFGQSISLQILAAAAQLPELEAETINGNLIKRQLVMRTGDRYSIHDVIREAVLHRVPPAEIERLRLRIAQSLVEHLTQKLPFEGRWCVAPPPVWRELEPDFESCLGAIRWCLDNSQTRLGWDLYRLIDYPLGNLGYWDQEAVICQKVIEKAGDIDPGQTAWWKGQVLGYIHWQRAEHAAARALAQEALEVFATLNDPHGVADTQLLLANIITYEIKGVETKPANYDEVTAQARSLFEQAIAVFEQYRGKRQLAHAMGDFADYWYYLLERFDAALPYAQRCIELYEQLGEEEGVTMAQPPLCDIYIGLGEYDKAEAMLQPMRAAATKLGRPDFEPQVDWSEAELREKQGDALVKKSKRKALAYYRMGAAAAARGRKAFAQVRLPHETKELQAIEQRLRRKIKKLVG